MPDQETVSISRPERVQIRTRPSTATVTQHYATLVLDNLRAGIFFLLVFTTIGLYKVWVAQPTYLASATIELETGSSGYQVDQLGAGAFGGYVQNQAVSAQMEILRSRSLLEEVVSSLELDRTAVPVMYNNAARAYSKRFVNHPPIQPPFLASLLVRDAKSFAWGGEVIELGYLDVPETWLNQVIELTPLTDGQYSITLPDGSTAQGQTQELLEKVVDAGEFRAQITALKARPGTRFHLMQHNVSKVALGLKNHVHVHEVRAGARGGSGILKVTVSQSNAVLAAKIANQIAQTYLSKNVAKLSEEAERKLAFLDEQLPGLKQNLQQAEEKLLELKSNAGSYVLSSGAKDALNQLTELDSKISELLLERSSYSQTLTDEHPAIVGIDRKIRQLRIQKRKLDKALEELPEKELDFLQLTRNAEVSKSLYLALLNKAQELRLAKAGTVGNVRILDSALAPGFSSSPNRKRILLTWIILGLLAGISFAMIKKQLFVRVKTPEDIEQKVGLPVYATVPLSKAQAKLERTRKQQSFGKRLLALVEPSDASIESLRSVRTSLHFTLSESKNNVVAICGPSAGVGKSFITANLATLMATTNQQILLIDADMRRGTSHRFMGVKRAPGLSDLIAGSASMEESIRASDIAGLDFITAGETPPNPSELLSSNRFTSLIEQLSLKYSAIIIDSPPVMHLADSVIISKHASVRIMVVRANHSAVNEVNAAIRRLQQDGIDMNGIILNGFRPTLGSYAYSTYGRKT